GSSSPSNSNVVSADARGTPTAGHAVAASYQPPSPGDGVRSTPEKIKQMEVELRDSLYPSQREWAAANMAAVDWRTQPQVVGALLTAAKEDPASTVRASGLRSLATMKVNTMPVV